MSSFLSRAEKGKAISWIASDICRLFGNLLGKLPIPCICESNAWLSIGLRITLLMAEGVNGINVHLLRKIQCLRREVRREKRIIGRGNYWPLLWLWGMDSQKMRSSYICRFDGERWIMVNFFFFKYFIYPYLVISHLKWTMEQHGKWLQNWLFLILKNPMNRYKRSQILDRHEIAHILIHLLHHRLICVICKNKNWRSFSTELGKFYNWKLYSIFQ